MRLASRLLALALPCLLPFGAMAQGKVVKIGILNDQSGLYADLGGQGSVVAAKMAAEVFGNKRAGMPIQIVMNPKAFAPAASHPFAETNAIASRASRNLSTAS